MPGSTVGAASSDAAGVVGSGFAFFATFVPMRTTRSSPSYDVVHVSERMSSPSAEYTLRVAEVRVGADPSSSTMRLPLASVGSSTRSTGTGPVTTSGYAELSSRRDSPP